MSFSFNNFLTDSSASVNAQIAALEDAAFFKDGSKSMEGTFQAGNQSLFDVKDAEFNYSAQVIPPAGKLSLYSKADDHLYTSTSGGVEQQLSSGGDVDGPVSSVDDNICSFDGVSGKIIQDSGIASGDVVQAPVSLSSSNRIVTVSGVQTVEESNGAISGTTLTGLSTINLSPTGVLKISGTGGSFGISFRVNNAIPADQNFVFPDEGTVDTADSVFITDGTSGQWTRDLSVDSISLEETGVGSDKITLTAQAATTNYTLTFPQALTASTSTMRVTSGGNIIYENRGALGPITVSSTATALARWTSTDGISLSDSNVLLDASDNMSALNSLSFLETGVGTDEVKLQAAAASAAYTITLPDALPSGNAALEMDAAGVLTTNEAAMSGPALGATDNAIPAFDGTSGKLLKNSVLTQNVTTGVISGLGGIGFVETGAGTDVITLQPPASSSAYTLTLPANTPASTAGVFVDSGGGMSFDTQAVTSSSIGATDNEICRFDSISGTVIHRSSLRITDAGDINKSGVLLLSEIGGTLNLTAGSTAGDSLTSGASNTLIGQNAGTAITDGDNNTVVGAAAALICTGSGNTIIGQSAGGSLGLGEGNVLIGSAAGSNLITTDSDNIIIKASGSSGLSATTIIGDAQTSCFVAGIDGTTLANETSKILVIDSNDQITAEVNAMTSGYIDGLIVGDDGVQTKIIAAGSCRSDDNTFNIVSSGSLTPSLATSGAGGLDTGTESSDTWYSIWVIADSVTTNSVSSLLSESSSAPTMPSGYDKKRRVGWARNDSGSNFYEYLCTSNGRDRTFIWLEDLDNVLSAGSAITRTAVDFSEWLPPTCRFGYFGVGHIGGSTGDYVSLYPDATSYSADQAPWQAYSHDSIIHTLDLWMPCNTSQNIYYENSSSFEDTYLSQIGYIDSL